VTATTGRRGGAPASEIFARLRSDPAHVSHKNMRNCTRIAESCTGIVENGASFSNFARNSGARGCFGLVSELSDDVEEYTLVVEGEIAQIIGEAAEIIADADLEVVADMAVERDQCAVVGRLRSGMARARPSTISPAVNFAGGTAVFTMSRR
jgi:hypothetical protein